MLVKAGQDPEVEDTYGQTPLHLAALRGNLDAAEYLVVEVGPHTCFLAYDIILLVSPTTIIQYHVRVIMFYAHGHTLNYLIAFALDRVFFFLGGVTLQYALCVRGYDTSSLRQVLHLPSNMAFVSVPVPVVLF